MYDNTGWFSQNSPIQHRIVPPKVLLDFSWRKPEQQRWGGANCCQWSLHWLISITCSQSLETSASSALQLFCSKLSSLAADLQDITAHRSAFYCLASWNSMCQQTRWSKLGLIGDHIFLGAPKEHRDAAITQTWTFRKTCRPAYKFTWSCIPWEFQNVFIKKMAEELTSTKLLLCVRNGQVLCKYYFTVAVAWNSHYKFRLWS